MLSKQVLSLAVAALKCYICTSSDSMSDCKSKMESHDCSSAGSGFDRCASMSVDMETGGLKVKSYVKSCLQKSMCDSGNAAFKQCKSIEGATCNLDCCDSDNCNGGTVAVVSVTLMAACAFLALFR